MYGEKNTSRTKITIERGRRKYEVVRGYGCPERYSFKRTGFRGMCEDRCHLPRWFRNVVNDFADGLVCLREISDDTRKS